MKGKNEDLRPLEELEILILSRKFEKIGDIGEDDQFLSLLYCAELKRKKIRQRQRKGIALAMKEKRFKDDMS